MANERKTENIIRKLLAEQGYTDNENIVIEEQASDNPKIDKLLTRASKSGIGKGYPEFIITFKNQPQNIIVVECKASTKNHQSKNKKLYKDYAVDGTLLYASYLKDDFNVIAIAVSGETEREVRISHFLWLKGKHTYKDITDKSFLNPASLFKIVEKQSQPLKEEELIAKAIEYNELLHSYSIPEVERCTVISSILVALQDQGFATSFNTYHDDNNPEDYNPNEDLIDALLSACKTVLKRNEISAKKQEIILREYGKIKSNHKFHDRIITVARRDINNTVLRDLILDVISNIMPYIENNVYDVLGKFYTQFIRYAGSDSKTGLVLTPPHITDLFCDLAEINENDVVFDPCCGTGGFLVSAMKVMMAEAGNDLEKHKKIKSNQLVGIESRADMFSHACSNMMMRGDGKSQIHYGDCFTERMIEIAKKSKPTKALLNPPYDVGTDGQLEFLENALSCIEKDGICVAICQTAVAVSNKTAVKQVRERLLAKHSLLAVFSMPDDLFYPVGVNTCILVFRAGNTHSSKKKTFFGYFKADGFTKEKHRGRIDAISKWSSIKSSWISAYLNKESIVGLSVTKHVTPEDEWCAEAYMNTDFSKIEPSDFAYPIKNYTAQKILFWQPEDSEPSIKISSLPHSKPEVKLTPASTWRAFRYDDIFSIRKGYYNKKPFMSELDTDIPFIGATENSNGRTGYVDIVDLRKCSRDGSINEKEAIDKKLFPAPAITVSNNGSVGEAFYQPIDFTCSHDVNPLYLKATEVELNPHIAMFLIALIRAEKYRWGYGRKWRPSRMPSSIICLPVDNDGNPDWQYMEDYIKSLPFSSSI